MRYTFHSRYTLKCTRFAYGKDQYDVINKVECIDKLLFRAYSCSPDAIIEGIDEALGGIGLDDEKPALSREHSFGGFHYLCDFFIFITFVTIS